MIEYQGRVDENGVAIGHGPKVLKEYYNYIKDSYDVKVYATKNILKEMPREIKQRSKVLKNEIVMGNTSFVKKITNKLGMFSNLKKAIKHSDADILWFFNVEYYLMLYLMLHSKIRKRVVVTMFLEGYHGGIVGRIKQWVFEKAQKKMDIIISTGPKLEFKNCEQVFIPDYCYEPGRYEKYRMSTKLDRCVCLGTMGNGKELEALVDTFARIGYPLIIAGRFHDKKRLAELQKKATDNITIVDDYLSSEDYLTMLSTAKYTVLPYSPEQYATQTSGVMQEAIFADTIVVSYKAVLGGNGIEGVGFDAWESLSLDMLEADNKKILQSYDELRSKVYDYDVVKRSYLRSLG